MPYYIYKDDRTGIQVEVVRSLGQFNKEPTEEEVLKFGMSPKDYKYAKWKRQIGAGIQSRRGPGWRGSKGNWIYAATTGSWIWEILCQATSNL